MANMIALVDSCMADYDLDGWTDKASHLQQAGLDASSHEAIVA
jgi:hypothetical protein